MNKELLERERVGSIVTAFYDVYNYYGYGLVENAYAGAMVYALADRGHDVVRELAVHITYKGRHVTWQRLDLVVDNRIVVEIKSTERLPPYASRQVINYLRASTFEVGVLLHFGPDPKFYRFVDSPKRPARSCKEI